MISIENLTVNYENDGSKCMALKNVNLTVPQGTVCAIIGPSGCGKSTLLKVMAGLIKNYQGDVSINGGTVDAKKIKIGFMPQSYGLLPWKNIADNIALGSKIRGDWSDAEQEKMLELIKRLGISGLEKRYPQELSGGQRQRAGLARVFLLQPDILLMDEPFSALDAITREEMQEVFVDLWQQNAITTVLVTHYVEEAIYLGQKIIVMSANPGQVAAVINNPLSLEPNKRNSQEFFAMAKRLRAQIKTMGRQLCN